jgi:hypothetical protein
MPILRGKIDLFWVSSSSGPPRLQLVFNALWSDTPFTMLRHWNSGSFWVDIREI